MRSFCRLRILVAQEARAAGRFRRIFLHAAGDSPVARRNAREKAVSSSGAIRRVRAAQSHRAQAVRQVLDTSQPEPPVG